MPYLIHPQAAPFSRPQQNMLRLIVSKIIAHSFRSFSFPPGLEPRTVLGVIFRKGGQRMVASLVTEGFDLGSVLKGTILVVFIEVFEL
jgi:hypothetical protein